MILVKKKICRWINQDKSVQFEFRLSPLLLSPLFVLDNTYITESCHGISSIAATDDYAASSSSASVQSSPSDSPEDTLLHRKLFVIANGHRIRRTIPFFCFPQWTTISNLSSSVPSPPAQTVS